MKLKLSYWVKIYCITGLFILQIAIVNTAADTPLRFILFSLCLLSAMKVFWRSALKDEKRVNKFRKKAEQHNIQLLSPHREIAGNVAEYKKRAG